jgi:hypothetical protein
LPWGLVARERERERERGGGHRTDDLEGAQIDSCQVAIHIHLQHRPLCPDHTRAKHRGQVISQLEPDSFVCGFGHPHVRSTALWSG